MDPAAHALTYTPLWWKQLLTPPTETSFRGLDQNSSIPLPLQEGLRKACATKASPDIQARIQEEVDRLVTFEEFSSAIDELRDGSAPGPSETTPNMLKLGTLLFADLSTNIC